MAIGRDRFAQGIVVRLFRAWSVLVDEGRSPLPRLQDIVTPLGLPDETADCERYARGLRVSHRCPFAAEPTPRESAHRA